MLRPSALNHVALTVTDMDTSLHFYRSLGLELLRTSGPDAEGVRSAVLRVGSLEINVFHEAGLVSAERENAAGVHHFCLDMEAESIEELMAELQAAGLSIVRGPVARRDGTSVFVLDPDGVRVELRLAK
jgi:catechol 2,3-dioxygenase-like lactoylglutathione lyase family enzyme